MYDVLVIGAGPAGISAAIYAKRAGANVLVLYYGKSNIEKATKIDNYYGFENGIAGKDLYEAGIKQAKKLEIELKIEEVLSIKRQDENFSIETEKEIYTSKTVIIATGNKKLKPDIKGLEEHEGKGVSYCAICDGFFYKNKNVAVIGNGKFAISEAEMLKEIASSVTILTNGQVIESDEYFEVKSPKIKEIVGEKTVSKIVFEDETQMPIDGIFIAIGEAGAVDFAKKLGIITKEDSILVDENMQTNIEGIYSCGNAVGGLLQISKAVYEGSIAGISAAKYSKENGGE